MDTFGRWIRLVGGYVRSWIHSVWIRLVLDTFKLDTFGSEYDVSGYV